MKNVMILGAGGLAFFFAACFSGALYWFAPINPCSISDTDPYGYGGYTHRETFCSGDEIHSYQYGARNVTTRTGDTDFFIKVFLVMFPMGAAGVTLIVANVIASRMKKKAAQAPPAAGPSAAA